MVRQLSRARVRGLSTRSGALQGSSTQPLDPIDSTQSRVERGAEKRVRVTHMRSKNLEQTTSLPPLLHHSIP